MCPNIEKFVPTRWWWRSRRMLRPVGSSILRSASTHSSLYQRCYFMSVICRKIPWQIITFNNCFSKDRSQSRVLDVVRSVTGAFNRSHFKLNKSLKSFSLAASTSSLSPFQGWDCHRSFRWGLVAISEGVWSFFCKNDVGYPKSKSHSISLANDLHHPKSKITFQQTVFPVFFSKRLQSSKIQNHISRETQRMQRNCSSSARTSGDSVFPKQWPNIYRGTTKLEERNESWPLKLEHLIPFVSKSFTRHCIMALAAQNWTVPSCKSRDWWMGLSSKPRSPRELIKVERSSAQLFMLSTCWLGQGQETNLLRKTKTMQSKTQRILHLSSYHFKLQYNLSFWAD